MPPRPPEKKQTYYSTEILAQQQQHEKVPVCGCTRGGVSGVWTYQNSPGVPEFAFNMFSVDFSDTSEETVHQKGHLFVKKKKHTHT